MSQRFAGTDNYVATEDLMMAVNAAVVLGRPLLVKGEPGTGKTQLAEEVAQALQRPLSRIEGTEIAAPRRRVEVWHYLGLLLLLFLVGEALLLRSK